MRVITCSCATSSSLDSTFATLGLYALTISDMDSVSHLRPWSETGKRGKTIMLTKRPASSSKTLPKSSLTLREILGSPE